jgi:hypothetical protein
MKKIDLIIILMGINHSSFYPVAPMRRFLWMCGITPPPAIVALMSKSNS